MHLEQQRSLGTDRAFVIARMGAIGGADFAQTRAAARHHIGQSKRTADFDQLAARHDHFASFGDRGQREQHRGGIVVDDGGGLGAGERAQLALDQRVAIAPAAAFQIEFEIDRRARRLRERLDRGLRQNRAAEVGMQHDAGSIDDGFQRGLICRRRMLNLARRSF